MEDENTGPSAKQKNSGEDEKMKILMMMVKMT